MPYADATITALSDIPALVKTFATTIGMTNGGTSGAPTFTPVGGGQTFTLTESHTASLAKLELAGPSGTARLISPSRATVPTDQTTLAPIAPTNLYLHGDITPQPWIAITVAYGYNWYRHMYIGVLESIGGATGNECISGMGCIDSISYGGVSPRLYTDTSIDYLFSGMGAVNDSAHSGGVNLVHANNPTTWRPFQFGLTGDFTQVHAFTDNSVIGGFRDGINEPYIARGQMPFANDALLASINLFATKSGPFLTPVGRPPGVRMLDVTNIDPETTITVGSDNWRIFPAMSRNLATSVPFNYHTLQGTDSSYMVGYAFKK